MKNLSMISLCLVFIAFAGSAMAADMGGSLGHDLDALWADAQQNHDLDNEDAVILLESRLVTLNPDGTRSTRVHRVVWIGTAMGIRNYADLRVPWDMANSTLEVEILRTWMDNSWWPDAERISDTAVVHTLPYAVRAAHDYTTMRETMLLHDGVELPCIMETAYTITEAPAFEFADDLFVMSQRDPAVKVEYQVVAPGGTEVLFESLNGQALPVVDDVMGNLVMTWTMDNALALKVPITAAPERYEAAVVWSTWPDWDSLRDAWMASVKGAVVVDEELQKVKDEFWAGEVSSLNPFPACRDWVNENVRPVSYDTQHWFGRPRPATRTYETGYGHALDRALLFSIMLDSGNNNGVLFFLGPVGDLVASDIPRLAGLGDLMVAYQGLDRLIYDPSHGTVLHGSEVQGRPWSLYGVHAQPTRGAAGASDIVVELILEPGEEGAWSGSGAFKRSGAFPIGSDQGQLGSMVTAILPGAELGEVQLDPTGGFAFDLTIPEAEEDENGFKRWVLGPLNLGGLPSDVHVSDQVRTSPILIGWTLKKAVKVRLKGDSLSMPEEVTLDNEAGTFTVKVFEEYGWTVVERTLELKQARYEGEQWPALRALLLEEQDPRHGTILFD
jgi:hypothetical protein